MSNEEATTDVASTTTEQGSSPVDDTASNEQGLADEVSKQKEIIERLTTRRDEAVSGYEKMALENAKLKTILGSQLPDMEVDKELDWVMGLSIKDSKVEGEGVYRSLTQKKASVPKPRNTQSTAPTQVKTGGLFRYNKK